VFTQSGYSCQWFKLVDEKRNEKRGREQGKRTITCEKSARLLLSLSIQWIAKNILDDSARSVQSPVVVGIQRRPDSRSGSRFLCGDLFKKNSICIGRVLESLAISLRPSKTQTGGDDFDRAEAIGLNSGSSICRQVRSDANVKENRTLAKRFKTSHHQCSFVYKYTHSIHPVSTQSHTPLITLATPSTLFSSLRFRGNRRA
jgi:hypothetical protein